MEAKLVSLGRWKIPILSVLLPNQRDKAKRRLENVTTRSSVQILTQALYHIFSCLHVSLTCCGLAWQHENRKGLHERANRESYSTRFGWFLQGNPNWPPTCKAGTALHGGQTGWLFVTKGLMIMRLIKRLAITCGFSACAALAQNPAAPPPGPGGPPPGHHRPPPVLMMVLDTNRDGELDASEIANAPAALRTLDKNGDGKLTGEELRPPPPPGATNHPNFGPPPGHRPPPSPLMAALDTNGDGELDADEIANASASLLKLDANGDGKLSREELRPQFHPGPGGPDSPPPPPEGAGEAPPAGHPGEPPPDQPSGQ